DGEDYPARLVWQNSRLQGVIATSAPLNHTCWLRIVCINDQADAQQIISLLWESLLPELHAQGVHKVALLIIRSWISAYVTPLGFHFAEEIITFRRPQLETPPDPFPEGLSIRLTQPEDLAAILDVDNRAFIPPWQMEREELRQAERISASCTVAELDGKLVGYELSTLYFDGAHLARLAVAPEAQGIGVARALLIDLLRRFERRGVYAMTVNTQATNTRSQHLYIGFGFERTGYDLPVWMVEI
ncbi:MAG: GNAT family N-acetyltransferase, partial [Chloroflexota bacterium]